MIPLEDSVFNSLMGRLEVPYRYHKTLHSAGRSQLAPSANLTDWLPIGNADDVWRQVRMLFNISSCQRTSTDGPQRSAPPAGPGTPAFDVHTRINSKYKPTSLPDDHPTHMLEESRRYYEDLHEGDSIPFLVTKRKPERVRTVILATSDKKRPNVPIKVQICLREWNSKFAFWTMDVNHKRLIVKNMSGAPNGGCKYNYWAGPNGGFEGPIAFSDNSATGSSGKTPSADYIETDSDAGDLQQEEITNGARSGQYFTEESKIQDLFTVLQAGSTGVIASQEHPASVISRPFGNVEEERPIQADQAGHPNSSKLTSSSAGHPSYVLGTARSLQNLPAKRRKTNTISDLFDRVDPDPPGRNAQLMSTLTARPSKSSQPGEVVQVPSSLVAQTNLVSGSSVSILPTLSLEKQENTWLQIRLEQDGFNRVKKFRSCFTVSQFFALTADARKIPANDLERAEVTIDGAEDNQRAYKIELMPGDDEEYMEALTSKIDAWPLEKGRCNVDVILYRHGQKNPRSRWIKSLIIVKHRSRETTRRFTWATESDQEWVQNRSGIEIIKILMYKLFNAQLEAEGTTPNDICVHAVQQAGWAKDH